MKVYFDNAATTPIRKEVIDLMSNSMLSVYGNPSSTHGFGRSAKSSIENARKSISKLLNCDPQEIIFTSGGTESDNSILSCAVRDLGVKKIISSPIEHHAVLETLKDLKIKGTEIHLIDLEDNGLPKIWLGSLKVKLALRIFSRLPKKQSLMIEAILRDYFAQTI